jgi:hypothetical protein
MHKEGDNQPQGIIQQEAKPHGGPEREPVTIVLDIFERKAQLREEWEQVSQQPVPKFTRARRAKYRELMGKGNELGQELKAVYDVSTDRRARLIVDVYTTMTKSETGEWVRWGGDLVFPEEIRQFMSRVAPMSEAELREELRKAQETLERRTQAIKKGRETRIRQKDLTHRERRDKRLERARQRYHDLKEQRRLQAEQQQQAQVFPPPTKE